MLTSGASPWQPAPSRTLRRPLLFASPLPGARGALPDGARCSPGAQTASTPPLSKSPRPTPCVPFQFSHLLLQYSSGKGIDPNSQIDLLLDGLSFVRFCFLRRLAPWSSRRLASSVQVAVSRLFCFDLVAHRYHDYATSTSQPQLAANLLYLQRQILDLRLLLLFTTTQLSGEVFSNYSGALLDLSQSPCNIQSRIHHSCNNNGSNTIDTARALPLLVQSSLFMGRRGMMNSFVGLW